MDFAISGTSLIASTRLVEKRSSAAEGPEVGSGHFAKGRYACLFSNSRFTARVGPQLHPNPHLDPQYILISARQVPNVE